MLDTSQISQIQQPQAWIQCQTHPGFAFDTICFNPECRQKISQIICSYCSQLEPHSLHVDQQHPIHKTSPGFRSINFAKDWHKLPQIVRQSEKIAKDFANLKTQFASQIDEMTDFYLRKLWCLSELLCKNAASKVCNRIRNNYKKHLECCVEVINHLQVHQNGNALCKEEAYRFIEDKSREECQAISDSILHLKNGIDSLFRDFNKKPNQQNNRVDYQASTQTNKDAEDIGQSIKKEVQIDCTKLCLVQSHESLCLSNKAQTQNAFEELSESQISLNQELGSQTLSRTQVIDVQSINKPPIGIDFEKEGTVTVWDANPKSLNYLRYCKDIKNFIIEDPFLTNTKSFKRLLQYLPYQLQGIHINCKSSINPRVLKDLKVSYLNLFPSFRFIQNTDRSKYFPKVEYSMPDFVPSKYIKNVFESAEHQKKNSYIYSTMAGIQSHVKQVNFIQIKSNQCRAIYRGSIFKLNFTNNLLILAFINIEINNQCSLTRVCKNNYQLHTIVFDNCKANYKRLINQIRKIRPKQLRHFQISGKKSEGKIALDFLSTENIFFHQCLETLILTNISFEQRNTDNLWSIGKLDCLTHLNLYDSWPISPKILEYLHKRCRTQLRYLNIGCSQRTDKQRFYKSPPFSNLQSLCLDYTEINQAQLAIFMKNSVSLKYLSIQNLNGERIENEQTDQRDQRDQRDNNKCYGLITPQFFMGLPSKSLKYVNIYNCFAFSEYSWKGFDELECIRVNEGLLSQRTIGSLSSKGIKVNIVKNVLFDYPKVESIKRPFRKIDRQSTEDQTAHRKFDRPNNQDQLEQIGVCRPRSYSQEEKAESRGLRLLLNKKQSISRATNTKTANLIRQKNRQGA